MRRRLPPILIALMLALTLLPAAAEEAGRDAGDVYAGTAPAGGGHGLLVTTGSTRVPALVDALEGAGCDVEVVAIYADDAWAVYVVGAPETVNARFPNRLAEGTAFYVRCASAEPAFTLTLLHHDDAESQFLHAGPGREIFGNVARFKTLIDRLRVEAAQSTDATVTIAAGGSVVANPQFKASIEAGVPYYDGIAMRLIGYDAILLGSEDFDFGPEVLENLIRSVGSAVPFISANLDFSAEPGLQALVDAGWIAPSTTVTAGGVPIGIVGATTPDLAFNSSPRAVTVDVDVAGAVQREIDRLTAEGVEIIILASYLQGLEADRELLGQLHGVDIAIGGGSGELLANPDDLLVPGDEDDVVGPYPVWVTDALGRSVPLVTSAGGYTYVGRLVAGFDDAGRLLSIDAGASGPVRVSGAGSDLVTHDEAMTAQVVEPVRAALRALASTVIATSEVELDFSASPGTHTQETNGGNLVADAILWQARQLAAEFGTESPDIALLNAGALRGENAPSGSVTALMTHNIAPFASFVSVMEEIPAAQLKRMLENAVSGIATSDTRFAQVAGFSFTWDPDGAAMTFDAAGNVTAEGNRIRDVVLDDGTVLVSNGVVVAGAPTVNIATLDFLARGGDQYPVESATFVALGVTYQQALSAYIEEALGGRITAQAYPEGGEGRITVE